MALDISMQLDTVWHGALVSNLITFGIGSCFPRFISSFLKYRSIRVVIDGVSSDEFRLNSKVTQDSVLSITLSPIFINDFLFLNLKPYLIFRRQQKYLPFILFSTQSDLLGDWDQKALYEYLPHVRPEINLLIGLRE